MEISVCVPMEEGIVRDVRAFMPESSAQQVKAGWLPHMNSQTRSFVKKHRIGVQGLPSGSAT